MFGYGLFLYQEQAQYPSDGYRAYAREALKAFKKITIQGKVYYTCNVNRLRNCDRLGSDSVIPLWRTHFFLRSRHFDEAEGVIFSSRPGIDLSRFSSFAIESQYIVIEGNLIVDPINGLRQTIEEDLIFASDEELEDKT